jgi:hypothetical protein
MKQCAEKSDNNTEKLCAVACNLSNRATGLLRLISATVYQTEGELQEIIFPFH